MPEENFSAKPRLSLGWRIALFIVCYSFAQMVTYAGYRLLLEQWTPPPGPSAGQPPGFSLGFYSTTALVSMVVSYGFWVWVDGRRWSDLGLNLVDGAAWRCGALWALLLIVPGLGIPVALGQLHFEGWAVDGPAQGLMRACLHLGGALAAAVSLELPFRGYLLGTLGERMSTGSRVLICSGLTWVAHAWQPEQQDLLNAVNSALAGAALVYLRLASGSLALPIAVTTVSYLSALLISSEPWMEPLVRLRHGAPSPWFSGSDYYAGLVDVWLTFLWLLSIYICVYLPSQGRPDERGNEEACEALEGGRASEMPPPIARIRPRRKAPQEDGGENGGAAPS